MEIVDHVTKGGKNLILDYIHGLDKRSQDKIIFIRNSIENYGLSAFEIIDYKKLFEKMYEIRVYEHRFAYTIKNNRMYFLHAFKKQKNKTEKNDINIAIKRYKTI